MKLSTQVLLLVFPAVALVLSQKNEDEGRPYEFGFTIDGQQHRHEKKDEKGIIQGEFGFITADGVYHVTVYATDENGNFRILSTKNIRISAPLDGSPATGPISPEAGKYLKNQPQQQQQQPQPQPLSLTPKTDSPPVQDTTRTPYVPFTTQSTIKPACGGCGYVTTQKPVPGQPFPFQTPAFKKQDQQKTLGGTSTSQQQQQNTQYQNTGYQQTSQYKNTDFQGSIGGQQSNQGSGQQHSLNQEAQGPAGQYPTGGQIQQQQYQNTAYQNTAQGQNQEGFQGQGQNINQAPNFNQQNAESLQPGGPQSAGPQQYQNTAYQGNTAQSSQGGNQYLGQQEQQQTDQGYSSNDGQAPVPNALSIPGYPQPGSPQQQQVSTFPPVSVDKDVIRVGGKKPQEIPIKDKFPGMEPGLPQGVEETDVKDLLYKFHYTVGFHGHYEKGLKNGAKIGGYFVNGRDGISRVVTYVADENGYRPKFKFINLGLDSDETPKEGSEKKFGLKSFEFVWYPVE